MNSNDPLLLGVIVVGLVVWALRRHLSEEFQSIERQLNLLAERVAYGALRHNK